MIIIENTTLPDGNQWRAIIRGMRNPMNSWDRSDSGWMQEDNLTSNHLFVDSGKESYLDFAIGSNDRDLMMRLAKGGPVHGKFRRMIVVYVDITAPLYWWKEFDTYKVGTVANSCSTMHKIHAKEFTLDDFSIEHLRRAAVEVLKQTIAALNAEREGFIGDGPLELKGDKQCWYSMIQLLPSSYNQKRTVMLNYEVLSSILRDRKYHKLDEWRDLCKWIETLPNSMIIKTEK